MAKNDFKILDSEVTCQGTTIRKKVGRPSQMRKLFCTALVLMAWTSLSLGLPSSSQAQLKKIIVQSAWVISGVNSGFFVAQAKGFYAAKGLDVTINRGFGSGDTAKVVASGKAHFGEINIPTAIITRGKGGANSHPWGDCRKSSGEHPLIRRERDPQAEGRGGEKLR